MAARDSILDFCDFFCDWAQTLADLHWQMPGARPPPQGPDSFVLTYKIFETLPPRESTPPLREILDPPLQTVEKHAMYYRTVDSPAVRVYYRLHKIKSFTFSSFTK